MAPPLALVTSVGSYYLLPFFIHAALCSLASHYVESTIPCCGYRLPLVNSSMASVNASCCSDCLTSMSCKSRLVLAALMPFFQCLLRCYYVNPTRRVWDPGKVERLWDPGIESDRANTSIDPLMSPLRLTMMRALPMPIYCFRSLFHYCHPSLSRPTVPNI